MAPNAMSASVDAFQQEDVGEEQFSLAMVHDLRAPVRVSRQVIRLLAASGEKYDTELWPVLEQSLATLDGRINSILRFAQAGQPQLRHQLVDMRARAESAAELVVADHGPVDIRVRAMPSVRGDASLLEEVFHNLLDNAAKYGGGPISVGGRRAGAWNVYWVQDNGPGIPGHAAARLFQPFVRGPGSTITDGHGLGLAIVRRLLAGHGGDVRVEAPGNRLVFRLPA